MQLLALVFNKPTLSLSYLNLKVVLNQLIQKFELKLHKTLSWCDYQHWYVMFQPFH